MVFFVILFIANAASFLFVPFTVWDTIPLLMNLSLVLMAYWLMMDEEEIEWLRARISKIIREKKQNHVE